MDTIAWSMKNSCDSRLESRPYCLVERIAEVIFLEVSMNAVHSADELTYLMEV